MAGNPEKHIVVRLDGSRDQLAAFQKGRSAAAVLGAISALAGHQGTLAREGGLNLLETSMSLLLECISSSLYLRQVYT